MTITIIIIPIIIITITLLAVSALALGRVMDYKKRKGEIPKQRL